ncbi:hypothetical protein ACH3XW_41465 [Acanthocheilonema viteae]
MFSKFLSVVYSSQCHIPPTDSTKYFDFFQESYGIIGHDKSKWNRNEELLLYCRDLCSQPRTGRTMRMRIKE